MSWWQFQVICKALQLLLMANVELKKIKEWEAMVNEHGEILKK